MSESLITVLPHQWQQGDEEALHQWNDRAHFYAAAAQAMRSVLIDPARGRSRQKRGGG